MYIYRAYNDGLDYTNLHNMVELDTYQYETLKYDQPVISDVSICHVFVCKVFKASGIFGDLENEVESILDDFHRNKDFPTINLEITQLYK